MKIGVISDIHGNYDALTEVLKKAKRENVEHLLVLGDIVGYYYHPDKVLKLLSEWSFDMIKGNHELILKDLKENKIDSEELKKKYGSGHEHALKNLSEEAMQRLFSLPIQKSVKIDNVSFQLNHGSTSSIDEYLYPDTPKGILEKCNSYEHDFVLIGHSHYSFSYRCKNSTLINCGSIGQSRQNGGIAYWAIVNTTNKSFQIKATSYNTSKLLEEVRLFDPKNEYSYNILNR